MAHNSTIPSLNVVFNVYSVCVYDYYLLLQFLFNWTFANYFM